MPVLVGRTLQIKPDQSMIKGGTASYSIDPASGEINYALSVTCRYFFSDHTLTPTGKYKVDPKLLVSKNLRVGQNITFGIVSITVLSLKNQTAEVHVKVGDYAEGLAVLSLARDIIYLFSLDARGSIYGMNFLIEAA